MDAHHSTPVPSGPSTAEAPAAGAPAVVLDISRLEPPRDLEQVRLEELTIDGICGVY